MFRVIVVIFVFISLCFSQNTKSASQLNPTESEVIIGKSRQAVGIDKRGKVSSFFYKVKTTFLNKVPNRNFNLEIVEEVSVTLPGKIQAIYKTDAPFFTQSTKTWNGEKYKSIIETETAGQRIVKDDTNRENVKLSKNVSEVLGKKTSSILENSKRNPKEDFKDEMWSRIFPLILLHPLDLNISFKYVGQAKSNDKIANVVDVKSSDGKTYRLLFDSETNYLLMMIISLTGVEGDIETKFYFSNRELVDNVMIPKKIKVENKFTATGKEPRISYINIDILEFKLNPELKESIFEIK